MHKICQVTLNGGSKQPCSSSYFPLSSYNHLPWKEVHSLTSNIKREIREVLTRRCVCGDVDQLWRSASYLAHSESCKPLLNNSFLHTVATLNCMLLGRSRNCHRMYTLVHTLVTELMTTSIGRAGAANLLQKSSDLSLVITQYAGKQACR